MFKMWSLLIQFRFVRKSEDLKSPPPSKNDISIKGERRGLVIEWTFIAVRESVKATDADRMKYF